MTDDEAVEHEALFAELNMLIATRQELKGMIEVSEKNIKDKLDPEIGVIMAQLDRKSATVTTEDGHVWSVTVVDSQGRVTLVREKLILAGVTNEQLKRGESRSKPETHITVKEIKHDGE